MKKVLHRRVFLYGKYQTNKFEFDVFAWRVRINVSALPKDNNLCESLEKI